MSCFVTTFEATGFSDKGQEYFECGPQVLAKINQKLSELGFLSSDVVGLRSLILSVEGQSNYPDDEAIRSYLGAGFIVRAESDEAAWDVPVEQKVFDVILDMADEHANFSIDGEWEASDVQEEENVEVLPGLDTQPHDASE